jgi:hypothetical protein
MTETADETPEAQGQAADANAGSGGSTMDHRKSSEQPDVHDLKDSVTSHATEHNQGAPSLERDTVSPNPGEAANKDIQDMSPEPSLDTEEYNDQALNDGYDSENNGVLQPTDSEERAKIGTEGQEPGGAGSTPGSGALAAPSDATQKMAQSNAQQEEDELANESHGSEQGAQV